MPRKEKFKEYNLKTKITTIRIPDLEDLDKEKELRIRINDFILDFLNLKETTTIDTSAREKLRRLYDIMNAWMLGKMNNAQIENIPESVIEEIEEIEESLNVHNV